MEFRVKLCKIEIVVLCFGNLFNFVVRKVFLVLFMIWFYFFVEGLVMGVVVMRGYSFYLVFFVMFYGLLSGVGVGSIVYGVIGSKKVLFLVVVFFCLVGFMGGICVVFIGIGLNGFESLIVVVCGSFYLIFIGVFFW